VFTAIACASGLAFVFFTSACVDEYFSGETPEYELVPLFVGIISCAVLGIGQFALAIYLNSGAP
jgi:hypothetical protein